MSESGLVTEWVTECEWESVSELVGERASEGASE